MKKTIKQLTADWDSGEGKPGKDVLIDLDAYTADPQSPSCMCAQGQVLHYVAGWDVDWIALSTQAVADKAVAKALGISRGHSILLRHINDRLDGAPSAVLNNPEKVLGEHAQLVLAFFKHLDTMNRAAWQRVTAVSDTAWDAAWDAVSDAAWDAAEDTAWDAAWDAAWAIAGGIALDAVSDTARAAAWDAAWAAARAVAEIQGHKILAEKGIALFFLPMFGFQSIQDLIDWKETT